MQTKFFQSLLVVFILISSTLTNAETRLRIATVSNPDMERMQGLVNDFSSSNPDIKLEWIVLDENSLRQRVTTDIATRSGQFDIVTIGLYEAPIWAERGWLTALDNMPQRYDVNDILPTIREALSFNDKLYAAPFYGESSFTMYRTDLFKEAGLTMPKSPSWDFIRTAASSLKETHPDIHSICLRGKPGWGENIALITSMANAYGGSWFDNEWRPQLNSEAWNSAVTDYVNLVKDFGPSNATSNGYKENLQLFKDGKCAMWIDATVAASTLTDPNESSVANKVGFALAPNKGLNKSSNWLWAWALAISSGSEHQEAAKRFVAWATSRQYAELVAQQAGWLNVPPGTRKSLYGNSAYLKAAPFAEIVLASIESADPEQPTVNEVPYIGIQYVAIPEFPGIATAVGTQIAKAASGEISTTEALENAQWVTEKVIERARFIRD